MTEDQPLIDALERRAERRSERREFFRTALGAAAATAVGAGAIGLASKAAAQTVADSDVLNFALNLEYLEANYYSFAVTGAGIAAGQQTGTGTAGAATGGRQVNFTDPIVAQMAKEIAQDEAQHVAFLRTQLGSVVVAQPAIDLGVTATSAFSIAAAAAGLVAKGAAFDVYASDENFLLGAFLFEDVGVTAYKGASTLITDKTNLEAAAGILAVEAYHASMIRTTLYAKGIATPSLRTSADAISDLRDKLDGTSDLPVSDLDQGISPTTVNSQLVSNIAPLGPDGIAFSRSSAQVLNIVYLNSANVSKGGFFPAGLNGTILTSAAN